jgi:phytoene dehydrogenase-like protein
MSTRYDAVVVGAGHNGLTCACYLAKAAAKDKSVASLFSAPPAFSAEAAAMEQSPAGMDEYRFGLQSMRSWCDQTFESEEVKCLFGAFALFMAHAPDDAGGAELAWLFGTVLLDAGNNLVKGGMHHVSLALADHLRSLGGEPRLRGCGRHRGNQGVV